MVSSAANDLESLQTELAELVEKLPTLKHGKWIQTIARSIAQTFRAGN